MISNNNPSVAFAALDALEQPLLPEGQGVNQAQPPSPGILQKVASGWAAFSKSWAGFVLSSHTVKGAGGVMMGLGAVLCLAGGAGVPLVIAGAIVWGIATAMSTTALEHKTLSSVSMHLAGSIISGGIGVGLGCMALAAPAAGGPAGCAVKFMWAMGGIVGGTIVIGMDSFNLEDRLNAINDAEQVDRLRNFQEQESQIERNLIDQEGQIAMAALPPRLPADTRPRVDSIVLGDLRKAYRTSLKPGTIILAKDEKTIHLKIDRGIDCISFAELDPTDRTQGPASDTDVDIDTQADHGPQIWIALRQSAVGEEPAVYTLHLKSSVFQHVVTEVNGVPEVREVLRPSLRTHPLTRVPITIPGSILENYDLLGWLDPTFKPPVIGTGLSD